MKPIILGGSKRSFPGVTEWRNALMEAGRLVQLELQLPMQFRIGRGPVCDPLFCKLIIGYNP